MHLRAENLRRQYGDQTALDLPELEIPAGQRFGLVGNNGAGKTTFLRLVLDLIAPTQGQVLLNGNAVAGSQHWKSRTGSYLSPAFLIDYLTPEEFFHFIAQVYQLTSEQREERLAVFSPFFANQILGQNKYIRDLSQGNQKKVGLAAALLPQPALLILDEPFANLDPTAQIRLKELLAHINETQHTTLLLSSHDLNHVTEVCTRIAVLENGRIVQDSQTSTLAELERYFAESKN